MPKNNYNFELTEEMKNHLISRVTQIYTGKEVDYFMAKMSARRFEQMAEQNKPTELSILDQCFLGPTSMGEIIATSKIKVDDVMAPYYAAVLEEMFGLSTKFKYNKEKNQYVAERVAESAKIYGDVFTFTNEELELGVWDKICAFFGVETDHVKRVNFIKESLEKQKEYLVGMNKGLAVERRNKYLEDNKAQYDKNKALVQEMRDAEADWKKAFFGAVEAEDYVFADGRKISALSACIAMYQKEYGVNICEKNSDDFDHTTIKQMKEIAAKYLTIQKRKETGKFDMMGVSVDDVKMAAAISYVGDIEVDYNANVPNLNEIKDTKLRNQAILKNNYVVLKMKVEMNNFHKNSGEYELTEQEKALKAEVAKLKTEIKLYEDIKNNKFENIEKHLKVIHGKAYIDKEASFHQMIDVADEMGKARATEIVNENVKQQPENKAEELDQDEPEMK